jgi:hypothetical protein
MDFKCPKCDRFIYNRRLRNCGYCNAILPEDLLLSQSQIEKLDKIKEKDEKILEMFDRRRANGGYQVSRSEAARGTGVSIWVIDYHIKLGNLNVEPDGTVNTAERRRVGLFYWTMDSC